MPVKPVVAVDIDGTLGRYHEHFINFAEDWLGRKFTEEQKAYIGDMRFWESLGLDLRLYRDIKLAYRQGGQKRTMPIYPGAQELMTNLRRAGAEIWIATTRPWQRLDNVDPDTREWLRRNGIAYDFMIYGEDKYPRLVELVDRQRIVGVVEDLPEQAEEAEALNLKPIVVKREHNEVWRNSVYGFEDVKWPTLYGAANILLDRINEWKPE